MKHISTEQLNQLRDILQDSFGLTYTDEELKAAGLVIVRFVLCKERRGIFINVKKEE